MTSLEEATRAARKAAHIARRDMALHPLEVQLYRAVTTHFAKQKVALKTRLLRRAEALNADRLREGIGEDIDILLDELFAEFQPQFVRDLDRITREGMKIAARHRSEDFGYQVAFNLDHPEADKYLRAHAAEQVTRIDETTRSRLKAVIARGSEEKKSYQAIARDIIDQMAEFAEPSQGPGTTNRAQGIVVYELGMAYETASDGVGRQLAEKGIPMTHEWSPTGDEKQCPLCSANAAVGPIPFDTPFPSGHFHPLAHYRCRCSQLVEMDNEAAARILGPREIPEPGQAPRSKAAPAPDLATPAGIQAKVAEIRSAHAARKAHLDALESEFQGLNQTCRDYNNQYMNATREERADKAFRDAWEKKFDPVIKRLDAVKAELNAGKKNLNEAILSSIEIPEKDRAAWAPEYRSKGLDGKKKAALIAPGANFLRRALGAVEAAPSAIPVYTTGTFPIRVRAGRGRSFHYGGLIAMAPSETRPGVFPHEVGHFVEFHSTVRSKNANAFLDYRTRGESPEPLARIYPRHGYGSDEWTRKDRFPDAYCGKEYTTTTSTEITSMGLQFLFEDAGKFLEADPEYFAFMLHQIRGVPWTEPAP